MARAASKSKNQTLAAKPVAKPRVRKPAATGKTPKKTAVTAPALASRPATKLMQWRELMGYTRDDIAVAMSVTVSYYGRLENGECWPRPDILAKLKETTHGKITPNDVFDCLV